MDQNLLALAGTAGTTVVALLATDAWEQTRSGVLTLWRRFRPEAAEEISAMLSSTRQGLLAGADPDGAENELQLQFAALLARHPESVGELSTLLQKLTAGPNAQTIRGGVHLQARAEGAGQVYQSVRDQTVNNFK
ncbi:hypothetical protein JK359_19760 [Streptomyces actinomycinicus]|uniref:Uncharacterized protein n=1 Tax=Streptomyces actinomycinicus TaxID=1695166 RepID=A0A937JN38_9ACTN|nr:hypothetical protein [Streptomyces actinomycinicus]MBL1084175.1 hypothetical protein [Streptomyces actinomycinicus]